MKERPILFSAPMVRAILDGKKTQTRRKADGVTEDLDGFAPGERIIVPPCKYGSVGDRLWVRETFGYYNTGYYDRENFGTFYKEELPFGHPDVKRWRSPIHMPRCASRILLEITDVRVQRLQEISEEDAIAEGVESWRAGWDQKTAMTMFLKSGCQYFGDSDETIGRRLFRALWASINGDESWDANPYVWAITFRRIEQEAR